MELATDPEITSPNVHTIPTEIPTEGVGIVEAPRGTLTHHYWTDERGMLTKVNLIVGTTNNYAPIQHVDQESRPEPDQEAARSTKAC
ncbi:MAG: nickel-dependent hydrogenase large subunit [Rhodopseudomonas palustris]|nr:nickel-dependent hydrogenase large subunit [Rhodopseudomonas palustris]